MKNYKEFKKTAVNEEAEIFSGLTPVKPKTLPSEVVNALNKRLADEYAAHYLYRNAANWCKGVNYPKAAAFFDGEAVAELEHALKIENYISQWNVIPMIPSAPTQQTFTSLVDVINKAYEIEYDLFEKYSADQSMFFSAHQASFNFIQEFVNLQNDAVAEFSDLLNALELIDTESRLDLLFFEDKYFG